MAISPASEGRALSCLYAAHGDLSSPEKKCERILTLINALTNDLEEDISHASPQVFKERVDLQFRSYQEIANLRTLLKKEKLEGEVALLRERCTSAYKHFIQNSPAFRAAYSIKYSCMKNVFPNDFEDNDARDMLWLRKCPQEVERANDINRRRSSLYEAESVHDEMPVLLGKKPSFRGRVKETLNDRSMKDIWRKIQRSILQGYQRARVDEVASLPPLTWVTGTSTQSLVCLIHTVLPQFGSPVLRHFQGPFCDYGFSPLPSIDSPGGALVDLSTLSGSPFPEIVYSLEHAAKKTPFDIWGEVDHILNMCSAHEVEKYERGKIAFQRLLFAKALQAPGSEEALKRVKPLVIDSMTKMLSDSKVKDWRRDDIENFIKQIDTTPFFSPKLTDEDLSLATNPSGMLFGSYTLNGSLRVEWGPLKESCVPEPLELGKDIQVVFVKDKDVERVRRYVRLFPAQSQIHVVSKKALYYLAAISPQSC